MLRFVKNIVFLVLSFAFFSFCINLWLGHKTYTFKERDIINIAQKHKDFKNSVEDTIFSIHSELSNLYPGKIIKKQNLKFLFFQAGGWSGSMHILHASLTEYILIFGSLLNTTGHSGRYWINRTDVILKGNVLQWNENQLHLTSFFSGSVIKHNWNEASLVNYGADMWKLSYGRGFVPGALPYVTSQIIFNNNDYLSLYRIIKIYFFSILEHSFGF